MNIPSGHTEDLIERLVGMDTTSRNSNLQAIEFILQYLQALGATCRLTHSDDGRKANIYASLGPADKGGVMLSGHTDVVPVDGQAWTSDPFRLCEKNGKLYGRGTADMKSFIALSLAIAPEYVRRGLQTPLHFSFSYDEELGCIGVRRLIADLDNLPVRPQFCIVGEPTMMRVVAGHKGKRSLHCQVHGKECHSALIEGVNAVEAAAELISHIKTMQRRIRTNGPFNEKFNPPYTTLHTGIIQGGKALNIVPKECLFEFEIRSLPDDDTDALEQEIRQHACQTIEPEMKSIDPKAGFAFTVNDDTAGFQLADSDPAVCLVTTLTGENSTFRASFGTEAGLFNRAGVPSVVCGPGSIEQAHKPDEFISRQQLAAGTQFMERLLNYLEQ
ncbi:MAG TPA: acetylornithine deacetylase [Rhodospirillaceae bacterium]|nr:acetylornithine deacetylase [Rhodospirillaceae bacterium]